ncbi:ATP-dependent protease LonB [Clostridium paraputrificum]|uniref:ATP-dependent protease LonB n=1 Tax=Clostridium paraputrificum TaxID=29363 RepID=UPI0018998238|nr:ATP-dependent protease LonB [Clostridium paraputrificum]MDB2122998.1 ATP-dependent protease LonB [Clostridium paraputrificum]
MAEILILLQIVLMGLMIYLIISNNKSMRARKVVIDKESTKELEKLYKMRGITLTVPLTEKSRPSSFQEVVGQDKGIKVLKAALCGPNPQHVIIYGPPGVGKTAAARLVLEEAKKNSSSPFKKESKFVEIDATTIRFDERGIADPLIGSVHDPIYQGAGSLGVAGIPQPKPGAVTKAHGGVLFIDEIGELHPIELNKLLKVLEDRKVFLDSSYYSSEDPNMPKYIKEVFENGLPADFRLIGATTKSPEDILPAIRSRCVEIFFRALDSDEIIKIGVDASRKAGLKLDKKCEELIGEFCSNGREVINLIQLCSGVALNENRDYITNNDVEWVIENCQYTKRIEEKVFEAPSIGKVNGLAVYGANIGAVMTIEASAKRVKDGVGKLKVSGVVEEESISSNNKKVTRKSMIISSVENVLTILSNIFDIDCKKYDIHVNIPGGSLVDGPSAGIAIATAIYSAIKDMKVNNKVAMTGEVGLLGGVKPIGGVRAKIIGAKKAGASKVIIPKENWSEGLLEVGGIEICPVENIKEVFNMAFINFPISLEEEDLNILSASGESKEKGVC